MAIPFERGTLEGADESACRSWLSALKPEQLNGEEPQVEEWNYEEDPLQCNYQRSSDYEFIAVFGGVIVLHLVQHDSSRYEELDGQENACIFLGPGVVKHTLVKQAPARGIVMRWPSSQTPKEANQNHRECA